MVAFGSAAGVYDGCGGGCGGRCWLPWVALTTRNFPVGRSSSWVNSISIGPEKV
jgi:hypothetical protein